MTEEKPPYNNKTDEIFARASEIFVPAWCQTETHWSSRLSQYLWPSNDCGCCLLFRGITIGLVVGLIVGFATGAGILLAL